MPDVEFTTVQPCASARALAATALPAGHRMTSNRVSSFASDVELRRLAAASRLRVDTEWGDRETFLGSAIDLYDAGILGGHHLAEMERRGTRRLTFGPDGEPISFRAEVPWGTGGYLRVNILRDHVVYVERSVASESQRGGLMAALRACARSTQAVIWRGTRAHLTAIGFPAEVFQGVLHPGRTWGQRRVMLDGVAIDVSAVSGVFTEYRIVAVPDGAGCVGRGKGSVEAVPTSRRAPASRQVPVSRQTQTGPALRLAWSR